MEATTLEDLFPETASPAQFRLTATGDTLYTLKTPTIKDTVEIGRLVGDLQAINMAFAKQDFDAICRLTYFLLEQDGKKSFLACDVEEIDASGEPVRRRLSGPEVLMGSTAVDDIEGISVAVLQAYANASPKIRANFKARNDEKKRALTSQLTTGESLKNSQPSTAQPEQSSAP